MEENKKAKSGVLSKLLEAVIGIFVGLFKGVKYLLMIFPVCIVVFVFCLIFFKDQTVAAFEFIRDIFIH